MIDVEDGAQFEQLQQRLGLPLPDGVPPFIHADGLVRLQQMQKTGATDEAVAEFRSWARSVKDCFGFGV
ncbi:MAG: hypothetical protein WCI02_08785 [Planctomycetota bacterium]